MSKTLFVPKVSGFDDLYAFAAAAVDVVDWPDEYPYKPEVNVRVAHDGTCILLGFEVTEINPRAVETISNGSVWEDSCVEFFVKECGSPYYYNFETNCIGTSLAAKRRSREDFKHFDEAAISRIIRRPSLGKEPVDISGPASWHMEVEIPFELFCGCGGVPERLEANFYKCGDKTAEVHFLSWNPVLADTPDFHRPQDFGVLILEK